MNIFDILKSITYNKDVDLIYDPEFKIVYNQYSINAFLMAHPSTVHLAMYASQSKMTNEQHYLFLLYCTESEYIYFKREYKEKTTDKYKKELKSISDYYNINIEHAKDLYKLLKPNQIKNIYEIYNKQEVMNGKKLKRI